MNDQLYVPDESSHVLCPDLYNILRSNISGGVIIANQGEACRTTSQPVSTGGLYTAITHSGEYYRVNCPFCRDTRHRLWVNHMFGQIDANGRPMRFLANCYNENCLTDAANREAFNTMVLGYRNYNDRNTPRFAVRPGEWIDPTQLGVVEMPGEVIPLGQLARAAPDHPAIVYMCRERRYTVQMLEHYELSYCTYAPRYSEATGRIIIPIRMNGNLVGWQARYVGKTDWRGTAKYYGMPGMKKRALLYNYDNAKKYPFVVVVEGATDVHTVGDTAVAILGKTLSTYQSTLMLNTWQNKPIVLIFDPDAREEMTNTVTELRANGAIVVEVVLPGEHDCGDYDRRALWNIIYAQTRAAGVILPQVA